MSWLRRRRSKPEVSPGGSTLHRHEQEAEPVLSVGEPELIDAIDGHMTKYIGEPEGVYHQILSPYVHVDIHRIPPSEERPWTTLVTSGMSELPMAAPPELGADFSRAELVMALPPDWPTDHESFTDERVYWPFRLLQELAALPHRFETWLWFEHTIPNGDPPEPYAPDLPFCCALLGPPILGGDEFRRLRLPDGRVIAFLGVYPLHQAEMHLKLEHGADALAERFVEAGVTELFDPQRDSLA
jgi:hypothetical protein